MLATDIEQLRSLNGMARRPTPNGRPLPDRIDRTARSPEGAPRSARSTKCDHDPAFGALDQVLRNAAQGGLGEAQSPRAPDDDDVGLDLGRDAIDDRARTTRAKRTSGAPTILGSGVVMPARPWEQLTELELEAAVTVGQGESNASRSRCSHTTRA